MSKRPLRWLVGPFVGAVLVAACTVVDGLILLPVPSRADGSSTEVTVCTPARWPASPPPTPGTADLEIVVAGWLTLGEPDHVVGFDLDGVCTCADAAAAIASAAPRSYVGESCRSATPHCDDPNGRDNSFRSLAGVLSNLYDFDHTFKAEFDTGRAALLIRVTEYNGLADDDNVLVSLLTSPGLRAPSSDGGTYMPPHGDESDRWMVKSSEVVGQGSSITAKHVRPGYVANHVLVVQTSVDLGSAGTFHTSLSNGVLTAPIELDDAGKPTLRTATIAGMWATSELLAAAGQLYDPRTKSLFCHSESYATVVKEFICSAADINIDADAGLDAPCNALSTGFTMVAVPASLGEVVADTPLPNECADVPVPSCAAP